MIGGCDRDAPTAATATYVGATALEPNAVVSSIVDGDTVDARDRRPRGAGPADRHRHARNEEARHPDRVLRAGGDRLHRRNSSRSAPRSRIERDTVEPRRLRAPPRLRVPRRRRRSSSTTRSSARDSRQPLSIRPNTTYADAVRRRRPGRRTRRRSVCGLRAPVSPTAVAAPPLRFRP